MIKRIKIKVRTIRRSIEAGRREMALHDKMSYQGDTWTAAQWKRAVRYSDRLNRLSYGKSPWVENNHH